MVGLGVAAALILLVQVTPADPLADPPHRVARAAVHGIASTSFTASRWLKMVPM